MKQSNSIKTGHDTFVDVIQNESHMLVLTEKSVSFCRYALSKLVFV